MIARMDLRRALEQNATYDNLATLLFSLQIDPRGAETVADGVALKSIFRHYELDYGSKLSPDQLKLVETVAVVFQIGGACFLRARDAYDASLTCTQRA